MIDYFFSSEEERVRKRADSISKVCVDASPTRVAWEMLRWPFAFILAAAACFALIAIFIGAIYLVIVGIIWIWPDGLLTNPISQISILDILRGIVAILAVAIIVFVAISLKD